LVAMATVLACKGETISTPGGTPSESVIGVWALRTIDGKSLPYTDPNVHELKYEVVSEVVTLKADGTYTAAQQERTTTAEGEVQPLSTTDAGTSSTQSKSQCGPREPPASALRRSRGTHSRLLAAPHSCSRGSEQARDSGPFAWGSASQTRFVSCRPTSQREPAGMHRRVLCVLEGSVALSLVQPNVFENFKDL
jgi:hypothetical protein